MLQDFLEENGCKFMSLRENFDTSGAAGSMVLNMMASIAEFERRQTGERVSHSFLARAKRGLYNGGSVVIGYKIDESKPGHLVVDPDMADIVRFAFKTFIKIGTLAETTKFLNSKKIKLPKRVDGGGGVRSSKFTLETLYRLLKNRAYIGVRVFRTKAGVEEVPAVWESIVDRETFDRANHLLKKNRHHKRTHANRRFPYTLSGLAFCEHCQGRMSGKSAHGQGGKVGYYEHIKHSRLQAEQYEKLPMHNPHRVPAAKIEPVVWAEAKKFILSEAYAKGLLTRARAMQESIDQTDEVQKTKKRISVTQGQIEVLAERIAGLPREIDPAPLLEQLSRLQTAKAGFDKALVEAETSRPIKDEPVNYEDLTVFRKDLKRLVEKGETNQDVQRLVIQKVVHKVMINEKGIEVFFHAGQSHFSRELGKTPGSRLFLFKNRKVGSSSLLTNGEPGATRTRDLQLRRLTLYPTELRAP